MRWRWEEKTRRTPWQPPPEDALVDELQTRLGAGNVSVLRKPDDESPRCLVHVNTTEVAARAVALLDGQHTVPVIGLPKGNVPGQRPGCVLINLGRMNALLGVDEESQVAHVQSGSRWRRLAYLLQRRGLTVGPLPRWVLDRSIAETLAHDERLRPSPRYGQLLDHVLGGAAVLPRGAVSRLSPSPRRATGPDLWGAMRGADHQNGLLTEVYLQAWPQSGKRDLHGISVKSWGEGLKLMWQLIGRGFAPSWWRLAPVEGTLALWADFADHPMDGELASSYMYAGAGKTWDRDQIAAFADEIFPTITPDPAVKDDVATPPPAVVLWIPRHQLETLAPQVEGGALWGLDTGGGIMFSEVVPDDAQIEAWCAAGAQITVNGVPRGSNPWGDIAAAVSAHLNSQPMAEGVLVDGLERPLRAGSPF
ncbi:MAG: FAD-binding oxidoreductase [Bradymonadia bacterium]